MANKNSFNIIGLDFDEAKASLKAFLQSQDTLKDYNFDGSVLSTILDVLAYNTHYQAFYANMVANEMFLDSAVIRPSVVSHAKALGYVPSSHRAAKAVLTVAAPGASDSTYLTRGSEFVGADPGGTQYRFVLLDTVYASSEDDQFTEIEVYEGTLRRMSYVYDPARKTSSVFLIPNNKIDTTSIRVRVKASATDNTGIDEKWTYADSYIDLTPTSKVFFLQEKEYGMYELFFGDNFLGKQPVAGNVVVIEYLETNGDVANGIEDFTSSVNGLGAITVVSASAGGSLPESVNRIKFLAPRYYQSQSRAVTEDDYTATVIKEYPNSDSVYVYGGETITPPQYGKVFIAIKPKSGSLLTASDKNSLAEKLRKNRSVVTVTPEIVDPDFVDIVVDSLVTFDPSATTHGPGTIKSLIVAYIYTHSTTFLESFGSNLYLSRLVQGINSLDSSILGNETRIHMRKTVNTSKLVSAKGISLQFKNPFKHEYDGYSKEQEPMLGSSTFSHMDMNGTVVSNVSAVDDGYGNINLITTNNDGVRVMIYEKIGTVDYARGEVNFKSNFLPVASNSLFTVTVEPKNDDIFVFENKILRVSRGYSDSVRVSLQTQTNRKQSIRG